MDVSVCMWWMDIRRIMNVGEIKFLDLDSKLMDVSLMINVDLLIFIFFF